jgi:formamidopyrimidine-DNA glycosylase
MPELPEVQTTIDNLIKNEIVNKNILDVLLDFPKMIHPHTSSDFKKIISNQIIQKIFRKGKYIFFQLQDHWHLIIHLRMSGKFYNANNFNLEKHEHAAFKFSNNIVLKFHDPRKFGKITLTQDVDKVLARIGIDALDPNFTSSWLEKKFPKSKRALKALLLDQSFISGIGNIYADEILFDSKLHPQTQAFKLTQEQIKTLYNSIKKILSLAVKNKGTSLGSGLSNFKSFKDLGTHQNYLAIYGKNKSLCNLCKTTIIKLTVCQRGTYLCPNCQHLPKDHVL